MVWLKPMGHGESWYASSCTARGTKRARSVRFMASKTASERTIPSFWRFCTSPSFVDELQGQSGNMGAMASPLLVTSTSRGSQLGWRGRGQGDRKVSAWLGRGVLEWKDPILQPDPCDCSDHQASSNSAVASTCDEQAWLRTWPAATHYKY